MERKVLEQLQLLLSDHVNNKSPGEALVIDVSLIKKKIHNDFLEDLIQYLNSNGFNGYYCSNEKKVFAFIV